MNMNEHESKGWWRRACDWLDVVTCPHIVRELSRLRTQLQAVSAEHVRALETLRCAGYRDLGGSLWKPPLGPSVSPYIEEIDLLAAQLAEAKKQLTESEKRNTYLSNCVTGIEQGRSAARRVFADIEVQNRRVVLNALDKFLEDDSVCVLARYITPNPNGERDGKSSIVARAGIRRVLREMKKAAADGASMPHSETEKPETCFRCGGRMGIFYYCPRGATGEECKVVSTLQSARPSTETRPFPPSNLETPL